MTHRTKNADFFAVFGAVCLVAWLPICTIIAGWRLFGDQTLGGIQRQISGPESLYWMGLYGGYAWFTLMSFALAVLLPHRMYKVTKCVFRAPETEGARPR